jgi:hypothetical protein
MVGAGKTDAGVIEVGLLSSRGVCSFALLEDYQNKKSASA